MAELNRENVQKVRDFIAALDPKHFNMRYWTTRLEGGAPHYVSHSDLIAHRCGSCACIGGWTEALLSESEDEERDAGDLLGLGEVDRDALFYPDNVGPYEDITIPQAVAVLDHLLETGEVDWSVASRGEA